MIGRSVAAATNKESTLTGVKSCYPRIGLDTDKELDNNTYAV